MDAYLGYFAGLGTSLAWSFSSSLFTLGGRALGSVIVNRARLVLAVIFVVIMHTLLLGHPLPVDAEPFRWAWLGLSGLIGYVFGDGFLFQAFVMIGPRLSMLLMALAPVISTILAWVLLGETLSAVELLGIGLTVGGVMLVVADRRNGQPAGAKDGGVVTTETGEIVAQAEVPAEAKNGGGVTTETGEVVAQAGAPAYTDTRHYGIGILGGLGGALLGIGLTVGGVRLVVADRRNRRSAGAKDGGVVTTETGEIVAQAGASASADTRRYGSDVLYGLGGVLLGIGLTVGSVRLVMANRRNRQPAGAKGGGAVPANSAVITEIGAVPPASVVVIETDAITTETGEIVAQAVPAAPASADTRRYVIGVLCGLGGALGQAGGLFASRMGLVDGFPALSGNLMRLLAATAAIWLFTLVTGKAGITLRRLREEPRATGFVVGGAFSGPFLGVWLSLIAVQQIPLGIATTLTSLSPILLLFIGRVLFKETITRRAVFGTVVAIVGTVLLFLR